MIDLAIELQRLIKKVGNMDIKLIAGENGVHNLVSWVHMVETIEASDYLEGGEIAFITGIGLSSGITLFDLAQNIYQHNAAGIIMNIGPFIEKVPEDVISFCNQFNFPLFVVPWKIHLAEIMRIFCFTITKDDQQSFETAAAFKNAIFFPKQQELYVVPLSQRNYQADASYAACIMNIGTTTLEVTPRLDHITQLLSIYAKHQYQNFSIFSCEQEILIVTADYTEEELHHFIDDLRTYTEKMLLKDETLSLGVGKLTKSIRCLYKSYYQAKTIQNLHRTNKLNSTEIFYSDLGIYKLLLGVEDKEILSDYFAHTIQPLIEYDEKNNTGLLEVLSSYLRHNGGVKETANELFIHRNTVNYRINKIEEILDLDLSSTEARLQLSIGLMLKNISSP